MRDDLINIVTEQDFSNYETEWKKRIINSTLNPTADNPLPQTKFWTWTYSVFGDGGEDLKPVLDYVGCKISVQFKNETNKAQSLSNIYIAGVGSGYLFKQDENDFVSDASATNINLSPINNLPATETSEVQHCYTYPKGNISSSPTLFATWNDVQYSLTLKDNQGNALTALNRNDYLQIVVTLTDVGLDISYVIAEWVNNQPTYIGQSPSIGDDGYDIPEWGDGTDVNIGGGSGGGDEPDTPVEPGEEYLLWFGELKDNTFHNLTSSCGLDNTHLVSGNTIALYFDMKDGSNSVRYMFTTGHSVSLSDEVEYLGTTGTTISLELTSDIIDKINNQNGLHLTLDKSNIIIKKLYVIPPQ